MLYKHHKAFKFEVSYSMQYNDIEQITSALNKHANIKKIRQVFPEISSNNFTSTAVTEESVKNGVLKLNTKK